MKFVKIFGIALLLSLFASCKSTDVEAPESEKTETEVSGESESQNQQSEEKPSKKDSGKWSETSGKAQSISEGIVLLRYKKRVGSFNIALHNRADKLIPVFSSANEFTSSAFFLKSNNKIIKLINDGNVKSEYSMSDKGLRITYSVPDTADVVVEFMIFPSEEKGHSDMVKVTASVTNRTTRRRELGLKAVLDTILGETDNYHFYTREDVPVKNEVLYKTMENEKWIVSRNINAAMQIFFYGSDCTAPECVALGNYSTFDKNEWIPNMYSYRQFDSVFAYNNSAVEVVWPTFKLNPNESGKCIFYMAFATDSDKPHGDKYLYPHEEEEVEEVVLNDSHKSYSADEAYPVREENQSRVLPQVQTQPKEEEKSDSQMNAQQKKKAVTAKRRLKLDESKLSAHQLTPEYVQNLLDRIIALEEDDASLNRAEIFQLNAELDAILEVLGL